MSIANDVIKDAIDLNETVIFEYDIDNEIGGLGNFIITSNVDDINYTYENNSNILTLIKYENTGDEKNGFFRRTLGISKRRL